LKRFIRGIGFRFYFKWMGKFYFGGGLRGKVYFRNFRIYKGPKGGFGI